MKVLNSAKYTYIGYSDGLHWFTFKNSGSREGFREARMVFDGRALQSLFLPEGLIKRVNVKTHE